MTMHPKAALCALAGFLPYTFDLRPDDGFRIFGTLSAKDKPVLYLRGFADNAEPINSVQMTTGERYTLREWADIPDPLWDTVTDDLIAKLFNLFGENE